MTAFSDVYAAAALGMAAHLLGLALLLLVAGPRVRAARQAWRDLPLQAPLPQGMPSLAVVLPLTGQNPNMRHCVGSILSQPGVAFTAWLVVRDEDDPAAALVRELCREHPHARLVFSGACTGCCQKNHSLLAGLKALAAADEKPEILVFCDSSHEARPDFLTRLTEPLALGQAQLSSTHRMVFPQRCGPASLCYFFCALFVMLLQNLPGLGLPWGGATAIRRAVFLRHGIDAIWARAVVDDFTLGPWLAQRKVHAAIVPQAALLTHLPAQGWKDWWDWWLRQLLYLKFCMPGTWLTATAGILAGFGLLCFSLYDLVTGGLMGLFYLAGLCGAGAAFGSLCPRPLPLLAGAASFPLMQAGSVLCFLATWFTNTLRWRGIAYKAGLDGTVREIIRTQAVMNRRGTP